MQLLGPVTYDEGCLLKFVILMFIFSEQGNYDSRSDINNEILHAVANDNKLSIERKRFFVRVYPPVSHAFIASK